MSYSEFVRSRFKPGEKIAEEMTPHKLLWIALQSCIVCKQATDLDEVKKYAIYNKTDGEVAGWAQTVDDSYTHLKLTPDQCELLHAAIGIAGEAGELLDAVRMHIFHGQPLDRENVIEELGDIDFYLTAARFVAKTDLGEVMAYNQAKLTKRYKNGYSDKAAIDRADKEVTE